jgi:two-component system, cell cycle sensor histidine kinase and response regulator CckA
MPGMNGWETLVAIRAIWPGIPVILSSGYDEAHVIQGKHQERPQTFLPKPYGLKDLQVAIEKALK